MKTFSAFLYAFGGFACFAVLTLGLAGCNGGSAGTRVQVLAPDCKS